MSVKTSVFALFYRSSYRHPEVLLFSQETTHPSELCIEITCFSFKLLHFYLPNRELAIIHAFLKTPSIYTYLFSLYSRVQLGNNKFNSHWHAMSQNKIQAKEIQYHLRGLGVWLSIRAQGQQEHPGFNSRYHKNKNNQKHSTI